MPFKKGPKNTLRYYSSSTGKYANAPLGEYSRLFGNKKTKMSQKEKEELKREIIYNKAIKSRDNYLSEVFLYLENNYPNCVKMVNEKLYHKNARKIREVDIVTKNAIIEIKSGISKHASTQLLEQKELSIEYNKIHIVYAPDITNRKFNEWKEKGIDVVKTKKNY